MKIPEDERGQRCPTGQARITTAGNLKAKYVIHTAGPFYNAKYHDKSVNSLEQSHINSLNLADLQKCKSIAFPAISTGAYRFPVEKAANVALQTVMIFLSKERNPHSVRFVLYKPNTLAIFESQLSLL